MNNRNILNRIHTLLNGNVKLKQMTLDNGTVVESESFEVGAMIYAIDGDNQAPLEIGTYTMDDGMVIEVTEIGIIGEVATKDAEVEAAKKEEQKMATKEEDKTKMSDDLILAVVEALKPTFDAMNAKIETLSNANTELKATLSKVTERKATTHKPAEAKYKFADVVNKANISGTEARIMALLSNK